MKRIILLIVLIIIIMGSSRKIEQPNKLSSGYSLKDIYLSGLMYSPNGASAAIVNGNIVQEGDTVNGFRIKSITSSFMVVTTAVR